MYSGVALKRVLLKAVRNRPKPSGRRAEPSGCRPEPFGRRLDQSKVESVQDQHETCDAVLRFAIYSRTSGARARSARA